MATAVGDGSAWPPPYFTALSKGNILLLQWACRYIRRAFSSARISAWLFHLRFFPDSSQLLTTSRVGTGRIKKRMLDLRAHSTLGSQNKKVAIADGSSNAQIRQAQLSLSYLRVCKIAFSKARWLPTNGRQREAKGRCRRTLYNHYRGSCYARFRELSHSKHYCSHSISSARSVFSLLPYIRKWQQKI